MGHGSMKEEKLPALRGPRGHSTGPEGTRKETDAETQEGRHPRCEEPAPREREAHLLRHRNSKKKREGDLRAITGKLHLTFLFCKKKNKQNTHTHTLPPA